MSFAQESFESFGLFDSQIIAEIFAEMNFDSPQILLIVFSDVTFNFLVIKKIVLGVGPPECVYDSTECRFKIEQ